MLSKIISFAILVTILSACAPQNPPLPVGEGTGVRKTSTPTEPSSTETFTPSPVPTLTPEPTANPETAYYQSLTDEQKALFDQTRDMTAEGFTRQFLTEQGLTNYLAYYDKDGEVAYVWNFEQGKLNPALKIENNLLINETSASHIIWNPELNRAEAQKTLADYFRYARARVIAGANHVQLGNTLESALANPMTQKYLEEGRNVTLLPTSRDYTKMDGSKAKFNVPAQKISISAETPIVFRTVQEIDSNMVLISGTTEGQRTLRGYSFEQNPDGVLFINYYSDGSDNLGRFRKNYQKYILTARSSSALTSLFSRAEGGQYQGLIDPVTSEIMFSSNNILNGPTPLIIYSQAR